MAYADRSSRTMFEHEKQAAQQALKAFRSARLLPSLGGRQRKPPSLLPIAAALAVRRGEFDLVNNRPIPIVERPLAAAMIAPSQVLPELPDDVLCVIRQFVWRERARAAQIIFDALKRWRYMVCFPHPVKPGAITARDRSGSEARKVGLRLAMAYVAASSHASCSVITDVD